MTTTRGISNHPSSLRPYPLHRKQVIWQIFVPVVVSAILIIGVSVLAAVLASRDAAQSSQMASVAAIWVILPIMAGSLVLFVLVVALIVLFGKLYQKVPTFTRTVLGFMQLLRDHMLAITNQSVEPIFRVRSFWAEWQTLWRKILRKTP